ncbi:hypothetical protein ABNF65_19130 [Paenibacillus larvae]
MRTNENKLAKGKLGTIIGLSIKSQMDRDIKAKIAYLIGMLEVLIKNTRYEADVKDAIEDYWRNENG